MPRNRSKADLVSPDIGIPNIAIPAIRAPALTGLLAMAVLILGFGLWSFTARLQGAVVVQGRITADRPAIVVQHPEGGPVAEVLVAEGDLVASGAVLMRLDGTALWSDLRIVEGRLGELAARVARLTAERDGALAPVFAEALLKRAQTDPDVAAQIDGQRTLFAVRQVTLEDLRNQLERRIQHLGARAEGLVAEREALDVQRRLLGDDLADQQRLFDQGLVTEATRRSLLREGARLDGQAGEVAAALAEVDGQVTETRTEITSLDAQRREAAQTELREIGPTMLELQERRAALQGRIARLELRAPVAGIVFGLQVTAPGAVLGTATPALELVPKPGSLVVEALVPPLNLDRIWPGQTAVLTFPSFAAATGAELSGVVTRVSPDLVPDPASGEARVMVTIALPESRNTDSRRAENQRPENRREALSEKDLVPGMPVEVYLRTTERTPIDYLTAPFTAYFDRAMREG